MIALAQEENKEKHIPIASIKVVGVGGAGGNTINCMTQSDYAGVELIAINTDAQALKLSKAHKIIQIGLKSTKGLGAGANPEVGKRAAEEDLDKVLSELEGADIVFLVGGMGGGTGSGALPIITKALKDKGILTVVVVTKPFDFEGRRRAAAARDAIEKLRAHADTLLIVPNQKLLDVVDDKVSMTQGFDMINQGVLNQSVKGVADIISRTGHINVDFADVREIMKNQGLAVMGTGKASGADRARKAALAAISSPLLENMSIKGAHGVLLNISGSSSLGLHEISTAASVIYEQVDPDANIILGSVIDETLGDEVSVTVIATGFNENAQQEIKLATPTIEPAVAVKPPTPAAPVLRSLGGVEPIAPTVVPAAQLQSNETSLSGVARCSSSSESAAKTDEGVKVESLSALNDPEDDEDEDDNEPTLVFERHEEQRVASSVIQLKDLDVPTFMRKPQPQHPQHGQQQPGNPHAHHQFHGRSHKKNKKNKHKYHQAPMQPQYQPGGDQE